MRLKKAKQGFEKLTLAKARIIAHLIGDGCHFKTGGDYVIKYEVVDDELLEQFYSDILTTYGLEPSWYWNPSGKTGRLILCIRLRSRCVFEDLLRYSSYYSKDWYLKPELLCSDKEVKREFLKALFDDEGSIRAKNEVILYSINHPGLLQLQQMLREFGLQPRMKSGFGQKRNVYGLSITDIVKFFAEIGFNMSRKQERLDVLVRSRSL